MMNEIARGDCQLVVMGPHGRVDLSHVAGFESRELASELLTAWEGIFDLERGGSVADDFIARIESADNDGGPVPTGTLYHYTSESDGSTSTYQYDGAVFKFLQAGQWRGDASVRQRVVFFASRRQRI